MNYEQLCLLRKRRNKLVRDLKYHERKVEHLKKELEPIFQYLKEVDK